VRAETALHAALFLECQIPADCEAHAVRNRQPLLKIRGERWDVAGLGWRPDRHRLTAWRKVLPTDVPIDGATSNAGHCFRPDYEARACRNESGFSATVTPSARIPVVAPFEAQNEDVGLRSSTSARLPEAARRHPASSTSTRCLVHTSQQFGRGNCEAGLVMDSERNARSCELKCFDNSSGFSSTETSSVCG